MGFLDAIKGQFLDVIQFEDIGNKLIVYKYQRPDGTNELKQGSQIIVREGQVAAFLKGGVLADVILPGTTYLNTENFPILSTLGAFPYLFASPVISDIYFVSTRQFIDNKWATKTPILKRDTAFDMVRVRAFGKFAFAVYDVELFMKELFGSKGIVLTFDIVQYLSSMVTEAFATVVGGVNISVIDLATQYRNFSDAVKNKVNEIALPLGIEFSEVLIEGISLPDDVEKLIDEQSGIAMASKDMQTFMQYQTARAMRDAAKQKGGLAGLGAGMALGNTMASAINTSQNDGNPAGRSKAELLRELKALLDEGILTEEEFTIEKKKILGH